VDFLLFTAGCRWRFREFEASLSEAVRGVSRPPGVVATKTRPDSSPTYAEGAVCGVCESVSKAVPTCWEVGQLSSASDAYDGDPSCAFVTDASKSPGAEVPEACAIGSTNDGARDGSGGGASRLSGGGARRLQCFVRAIVRKYMRVICMGINGARRCLR
jgi:hypothetical protein